MHQLYDVGYMEVRDAKLVVQLTKKLQAALFDVRFSPFSRDPRWAQYSLKKSLEGQYHWDKCLGNKNYKGWTIEIVDLPSGLATIRALLEEQPVILMCMCADRGICHRKVIAEAFEQMHGLASIPLNLAKVMELLGQADNSTTQLSLFD